MVLLPEAEAEAEVEVGALEVLPPLGVDELERPQPAAISPATATTEVSATARER